MFKEKIFFKKDPTDLNGIRISETVIVWCVVSAMRILSSFKPIQRIPRLDPISLSTGKITPPISLYPSLCIHLTFS